MRIGRRSSGRRPAPAVDPAVDSTPAAPRADVGLRGRLPVVYPTVIAVAYISILYVTSGASIFSAVRLLLVTIIATYLVTALLTAIFRDRDRGGLATTGLVLAFLFGADPKQALPGLALMLVVVLDALLARSRPSRLPWHTITRVGTAIATVLFLAVAIKGVSEGLPGRIAEDWSTEGPFRPNATAAGGSGGARTSTRSCSTATSDPTNSYRSSGTMTGPSWPLSKRGASPSPITRDPTTSRPMPRSHRCSTCDTSRRCGTHRCAMTSARDASSVGMRHSPASVLPATRRSPSGPASRWSRTGPSTRSSTPARSTSSSWSPSRRRCFGR